MAKRLLDLLLALAALSALSPLLLLVAGLIWLQDRHSPFYIAERTARGGGSFRMIKFRSMVINADRSGVDSTAADDRRITALGHFIRRFKLDELPQLWNVLRGDMSFVGPRPNVERETRLYTDEERRLLGLRPGITDLSSIVFSDEGGILAGSDDPDLRYNQFIRPWKSRLSLLYVAHHPLGLDLRILALTALALVSKRRALRGVRRIVARSSDDPTLLAVAGRDIELPAAPPPGATQIVSSRTTGGEPGNSL
jgi:lipopolysaccharide/colanic/teichoic acid biosynthesis glycosyltransferase